jgi:hypothetical protein
MKKNCILALMLVLGVPASMLAATNSHKLTTEDCTLVFPSANSCERMKEVESGVIYGEAWSNGSWETTDEFLGYIFLRSVAHEGKTIKILIGMTNTGAIAKVKITGIDGVDEKFLAQFQGKTWQDGFDIARTPEDLLYIPTKIRAMKKNIPLSESIAQGVKEAAALAPRIIKK